MRSARWQELEFRHLEYAIALRQHQGFVQAAIALGLDQGYLSKQIQRLEKRLGFVLFDRTTRPLGLTNEGQAFLGRAERIIEQTKKAVELSQDIQAGKRGRLDVGVNTSIANSELPYIVQVFCKQFPFIDLILHELPSYDQIEQLQNHQIDVGFFHKHSLQKLHKEDGDIFSETLVLTEPLILVLPERHSFARQRSVSLTELNGANFILPPYSRLNGLREQIDQLCARASCKPVVVQEASWITVVLSLVAGGMGVSLLPENVRHLQRTGVVYRNIQEFSPVLEIVAVYRKNNMSAVLQNFLEVVQNATA